MRRYFEPVTRGTCWVLAAILFCQAASWLLRKNSVASLTVPETFLTLKTPSAKPASAETHSPPLPSRGSNALSAPARGTHVTAPQAQGTNSLAGTNGSPSLARGTNASPAQSGSTNLPVVTTTTPSMPTSRLATMPPSMAMGMPAGMPGGMGMGGSMGPGRPQPLPVAAQAWVDKVKDSEVFGPVARPMPMALLGIAGEDVFFRAPNGQAGVFRKGEEMGGVKLLRTSANRILVEQDGQKTELTIFSGIGSESLMPVEKNKPQ